MNPQGIMFILTVALTILAVFATAFFFVREDEDAGLGPYHIYPQVREINTRSIHKLFWDLTVSEYMLNVTTTYYRGEGMVAVSVSINNVYRAFEVRSVEEASSLAQKLSYIAHKARQIDAPTRLHDCTRDGIARLAKVEREVNAGPDAPLVVEGEFDRGAIMTYAHKLAKAGLQHVAYKKRLARALKEAWAAARAQRA